MLNWWTEWFVPLQIPFDPKLSVCSQIRNGNHQPNHKISLINRSFLKVIRDHSEKGKTTQSFCLLSVKRAYFLGNGGLLMAYERSQSHRVEKWVRNTVAGLRSWPSGVNRGLPENSWFLLICTSWWYSDYWMVTRYLNLRKST